MEQNNNNQQPLSEELFEQMKNDKQVRTAITQESFTLFFHFYYAHYIKYETAPFQKEIMSLIEHRSTEDLYIVAFRGSGKSTMVTTAYPVWAMLGKEQKKFVVIFCQTKAQARQHMANIRSELEGNDLLKNDLGPFKEESNEWGSHSLVFTQRGVRLMVASTEQSIRGLRHHEHRPDLIICDDIEDLASTKTRDSRNKTHQWLKSEVIPAGDKHTRLVLVGNLLHEDSVLMRIRDDIMKDNLDGVFKYYPLLDSKGMSIWPGKYPDQEAINKEKKRVGDERAWQREYLLNIIPDEGQVIHQNWIQTYKHLPPKNHSAYRWTVASVDLAISEKEQADYTAVVQAVVYGCADKTRIYILPNPINKKLAFPEQTDLMKTINRTVLTGSMDELLIEGVGYQQAMHQYLESQGVKAEIIKPTSDKRTRLALTASLIRDGIIKFPEQGCELMLSQIVNFGVEKHDDLADAFSMLVNHLCEKVVNGSKHLPFFFLGDDLDDYLNPHYLDIEEYFDVN
jgi:predicted phage terminase large subunit-like protein